MTGVDNVENKASKSSEIILPLLGVFLESTAKKKIQWLGKSIHMDHSENFEPVPFLRLTREEPWNSGDDIENKVKAQVVLSNREQFLVCSGLFDEVKHDLHEVDDINSEFKLLQGIIVDLRFWFGSWISTGNDLPLIICTVFIDISEHQKERSYKKSVYSYDSDQEIPHFAECSIRVDQIPFELGLRVDNLVLIIGVLVDIVYHHLFQI